MNLWFGGTIYTMESIGHTVEAILEKDGIIIEVGSERVLRPKATNFIDLQGAVLFPGFVDSHIHIIGYGEKLLNIDASSYKTTKDLLQALQQRSKQVAPNDWIVAIGYPEGQYKEAIFPTLEELNKFPNPILIKRSCHHMMMANTNALQFANITSTTKNPVGGIIEKKEGQLTGILKDKAIYLIVNHMPITTPDYVMRALQAAVCSLHQYGLVGAHSEDLSYYGHPSIPLSCYKWVIAEQNFKIHLLQHHDAWDELQKIPLSPSKWLELGAMKIFLDGAFGGRTAALMTPYADDPNNFGLHVHSMETLIQLVQKARAVKQTIATHTIGDAALERILSILEQYPPMDMQKDRIIHCGLANREQVKRLALLPIIVDIQPQFIQSEQMLLTARLGYERVQYVYPIRSLLDHNIICAGGSDAPIETPNPLYGIYTAVTRRNVTTGEILNAQECCTRFEAISLYTLAPAKAAGKESIRGKIAVGYEADFTIVNQDILTIDAEEILNSAVLKTVVHGKVVYENKKKHSGIYLT